MCFKYVFHLALIATLVALTGCAEDKPAEVETVRSVRALKVGDLEGFSQHSFPGRAQAAQEVDLSFRVTGPLIARPVNVGDQVAEGGLIARIDPRDFEVRVREAEGNLQRAVANKERAENDYERALSIQKQDEGAISQAQIDRSKEQVDLAAADIAALEAVLDGARDDLEYTHLLAPFEGIIVSTYVENFQLVRVRQPIARLLDKTRIQFVVSIPETLISLAPYVEDIDVEYDAFRGVKIPAKISEIGTEASATTRTFPVTLIMDQPDGVSVLPGMAGRATGTARPPDDSQGPDIVIPVTAVFSPEIEGQSYVWVIDESTNTVSQREVEIQALVSSGLAVQSGLESGEIIATAGVRFLREGQQVKPLVE